MTFTVKALVKRTPKNLEVTTNIAGCQNAAEAIEKFRTHYPVVTIRWVKPVEEKKK